MKNFYFLRSVLLCASVLILSACNPSVEESEGTVSRESSSQESSALSFSSTEVFSTTSSSEEEEVMYAPDEVNKRVSEAAKKIEEQYKNLDYTLETTEKNSLYDGSIIITYNSGLPYDIAKKAEKGDSEAYEDYKMFQTSFWEMFCEDLPSNTNIIFKFGSGSIASFERRADGSGGFDSVELSYNRNK